MEEKKPKRPRIGALPTTSENTENKDQYFQSRPYKGTERPEFPQRGFQPRPRQTYQNSYSNAYHNREESGYNRQARPAYQQRTNTYNRNYQNNNSSEDGYKRYSNDSESTVNSSENSYQSTQTQGTYQNRQGGYNRQPGQQGGYQKRQNT